MKKNEVMLTGGIVVDYESWNFCKFKIAELVRDGYYEVSNWGYVNFVEECREYYQMLVRVDREGFDIFFNELENIQSVCSYVCDCKELMEEFENKVKRSKEATTRISRIAKCRLEEREAVSYMTRTGTSFGKARYNKARR